jgi:hypothetical protein
MAIAPSPGLLRVHDLTTEGLELAWDLGAGVVTGTWNWHVDARGRGLGLQRQRPC